MTKTLKPFLSNQTSGGCGCGPACRCGDACRCPATQRCNEACSCAA